MKRPTSFFNLQALTSCISMTLVLVLLGAVLLFMLTARNLSNQVRENITITMLMSDDISPAKLQEVKKMLSQTRYAKDIQYISKEKALEDMTQYMGSNPEEFLGYNPFTASLEVGLKADYANNDSIRWITTEMKRMPYVVDLSYQTEWVETINYMIEKVSIALLSLSGLLLIISIVLINNTLRLSVHSNRFLINTMKMVGASWSFIRRPFLWKSVALGLMAALVADGMMGAAVYALIEQEPELQEIITPEILICIGGALPVFGMMIALICAYFSVNRFLHMKTKKLYTV